MSLQLALTMLRQTALAWAADFGERWRLHYAMILAKFTIDLLGRVHAQCSQARPGFTCTHAIVVGVTSLTSSFLHVLNGLDEATDCYGLPACHLQDDTSRRRVAIDGSL